MKNIPVILTILLLVLIFVVGTFLVHRQIAREQDIKNIATFGEQHKYEDFVLKKGTCVRIKTEIGDVLVCLPDNGRPELLVAPQTNEL
jgi:hypothetical protein